MGRSHENFLFRCTKATSGSVHQQLMNNQVFPPLRVQGSIERFLESDMSQPIRVGKYASDYANHFNTIKGEVGIGRSTDCVRQKLCPLAKLHLCGHTQVDRDVVHALTDEVFVSNLLDGCSSNVHDHVHVHHALS